MTRRALDRALDGAPSVYGLRRRDGGRDADGRPPRLLLASVV